VKTAVALLLRLTARRADGGPTGYLESGVRASYAIVGCETFATPSR
jgi:hypothetical protein